MGITSVILMFQNQNKLKYDPTVYPENSGNSIRAYITQALICTQMLKQNASIDHFFTDVDQMIGRYMFGRFIELGHDEDIINYIIIQFNRTKEEVRKGVRKRLNEEGGHAEMQANLQRQLRELSQMVGGGLQDDAEVEEEEKHQPIDQDLQPPDLFQSTNVVESSEDENPGMMDLTKINQNLLILQNQIQQAHYALGLEDNPEMVAEDILRDPIRRSQIETFESMFFNEGSIEDLSHGFQVIAMNRDEKKFFIKMIKDYQIIIQLFPALF